MRVAVVVPEFRTEFSGGGGMATVAEFIHDGLVSAGHHVEYVSVRMSRRAGESRRILAPQSWRRGPVLRHSPAAEGVITYAGTDLAELEFVRYHPTPALTAHLNTFDLVVVVSGSPIAFSLLRGVTVPAAAQVATLASVEREAALAGAGALQRLFQEAILKVVRRVERRNARIPGLVFTENTFMATTLPRWGSRRVVLIPPGVDTEVFCPPPQGTAVPHILSVGRLNDPRKNFAGLLRAYAQLASSPDPVPQLVLAGLYDLTPQDRALIQELGLTGRVRVVCNASREELVALYQGAKVFVLASYEEGLGLALIEAMACGAPVVTTATEGAKHVLGDSAVGQLVPLGAGLSDRLAQALGAELGLDRARRSREVRERAVCEFSATQQAERFNAELMALCGQDAAVQA